MRRLYSFIAFCLLLLASSAQSWGDPVQYLPSLGYAHSDWLYDIVTSIPQTVPISETGSRDAPVSPFYEYNAEFPSPPGSPPLVMQAVVQMDTWFDLPAGAASAAHASTFSMDYTIGAVAESDFVMEAGLLPTGVPPEEVPAIPVIFVATGGGEGMGDYSYTSFLELLPGSVALGSPQQWLAEGSTGEAGTQFDTNYDLYIRPGDTYVIDADTQCAVGAGWLADESFDSECEVGVDPIFVFDQAKFDQEMGANTFPLDKYYSIRYSPNIVTPEPSTLLLTGFGIAVLAPCLRRRRVLPRGPNA